MTKTEFKKNYKQVSSNKWIKRNFFSKHRDVFYPVFICLASSAIVLLMIACM